MYIIIYIINYIYNKANTYILTLYKQSILSSISLFHMY
jgi:hypothetical protein